MQVRQTWNPSQDVEVSAYNAIDIFHRIENPGNSKEQLEWLHKHFQWLFDRVLKFRLIHLHPILERQEDGAMLVENQCSSYIRFKVVTMKADDNGKFYEFTCMLYKSTDVIHVESKVSLGGPRSIAV